MCSHEHGPVEKTSPHLMSSSIRDTEETEGCVSSVTYIQANQAKKE